MSKYELTDNCPDDPEQSGWDVLKGEEDEQD